LLSNALFLFVMSDEKTSSEQVTQRWLDYRLRIALLHSLGPGLATGIQASFRAGWRVM
jgi:hypothetical protein